MQPHYQSAVGLRETLLAVVSGEPAPAQVNALVQTSHAMALMLLRNRHGSGHAMLLGGISESDLAYDCVADLFRKDAGGSFVGLKSYFGGLDLSHADDAELLVYLRRLVSSAVNQRLFRVFSEIDPALGKIIRNMKLSIQALGNFTETEVFGKPCIVPILCETLSHLSPLDQDQLVRLLIPSVRGDERVPELLAALSNELRNQDTFSRVVPLVVVALAFREIYARKSTPAPDVSELDASSVEDLLWALDRACSDVKKRTGKKYMDSGKLPQEVFQLYFLAIKEYLRGRLDGSEEISLHDSLIRVAPHIGNAEYRQHHRSRLEYLAGLVHKQTLRLVRR